MPRRGRISKRDVLPDPLYNSKLVTKLINNVMYDGKKGVAQKIVYGAFDIIADKTGKDVLARLMSGGRISLTISFMSVPVSIQLALARP